MCSSDLVSFNNANALPNKFFECLHAGIGVVVGPSGDMARLVREFGCGRVSESFSPVDVARVLESLDAPAVEEIKSRASSAAAALSAESAANVLRERLRSALSRNPAGAPHR